MWRLSAIAIAVSALASACQAPPATCSSAWSQWGGDPAHAGAICERAQPLRRPLYDAIIDPFAPQEEAAFQQGLNMHFQVPLVAGDDVYVEVKTGRYTPCELVMTPALAVNCPPSQKDEVWNEQHLRWHGDRLEPDWTFASDWKPAPIGGFEPMFQPTIAGDALWLPGARGSVIELDRATGVERRRVQPFDPSFSANVYVSSGLATDEAGNVYYTATWLERDDPRAFGEGWLIAVHPDGSFASASFDDLTKGAPFATASCERDYAAAGYPQPWPPMLFGKPLPVPQDRCGAQRPAMNATPAIGPDGTIFVVSRAHWSSRYGYVVAVTPELTTRWKTSLRNQLHDGCGVHADCTPNAPLGVDPATADLPAGEVSDESSSSPVALPDGGVLYGAWNGYNHYRGHLFQIDASGAVTATFPFGWDTTPAVWRHDGTYSIILKDNTHDFDPETGTDLGPYYLTQLDAHLRPEWQFQSTNTESCTRDPATGDLSCLRDHPFGFEWCINAPAVDRDGTVYANSEDGNLYAIAQGGREVDHLFLDMAVGAAYTPLSIDAEGRIYTLNNGRVTVVGR